MKISMSLSTSLAIATATLSHQAMAFSPNTLPFKTRTISATRTTSLNSARVDNSEDVAMSLLFRARECADSESCSLEMANGYLSEVVHMQSGCAAGTLNGAAVCDDVLLASEVVASLRAKIGRGSESVSKQFWSARQAELESLTLASMNPSDGVTLSPTAAITNSPLRLLYLGLGLFYLAALLSVVHPVVPDAIPFTAQEWWWAARDGYIGDMVSESMKYGGLMSLNPESNAVSFTGQEWWWAIRDGYVGDLVSENLKYGGFMSLDGSESASAAMPFTAQEWWWAARDGYLGDMISHSYRNGGL